MNRIEYREGIFPYVEYAPATKRAKMPLVVQLHGAGERGNGKEELARVDTHGFSKLLKDGQRDGARKTV